MWNYTSTSLLWPHGRDFTLHLSLPLAKLRLQKKSYGLTLLIHSSSCYASPSSIPLYITLQSSSHSAHMNVGSNNLHQQQTLWAGWHRPLEDGREYNNRQKGLSLIWCHAHHLQDFILWPQCSYITSLSCSSSQSGNQIRSCLCEPSSTQSVSGQGRLRKEKPHSNWEIQSLPIQSQKRLRMTIEFIPKNFIAILAWHVNNHG